LQKALHESIDTLPRIALVKLLVPKLKAAGIRDYRRKSEELAEHLLSTGEDTFSWGSAAETESLVIAFTEEDHKELEKIAAKFTDALTDVIPKLAKTTAQRVLRESKRRWREDRYLALREMEGFRLRLEDRWGEGLDLLRLLLEIAREVGVEYHSALAASRARKNRHLRTALLQLHIRACQVAHEILVLLENGLADGAMARWRTLHEIATVALVIDDGGDDLAERYLAFDVVETKKALDQYVIDYDALGYAAPSAKQIKRTNAAYDAAVQRFGESFGQSYGWAAKYLKLKSPRFTDIQKAAGRAMMQSHYKMASYNVHATPRALSFRLGSVNEPSRLTAGATNGGFQEPGHNMAFSLVQITSLLCSREPQIDDLVTMETLVRLRNESAEAMVRIGKALAREDREIRRALAKQGIEAEVTW
jgi:transposase